MRTRMTIDDKQPLWRGMLIFLIPLMLSNALQSASATFNSIFLGQLIGVNALAAVSVFFPVVFFLISFFIGISNGSTILIGQAYGAKDMARVREVAGTTLCIAVLLGAVLGLGGAAFTAPILRLIGTPPNIFDLALAYARVIFIALPILFVYLGYTTFLRGVGDSQTPFYVLFFTTLLGLVLTPAFIRGWLGLPQLGVASAAVASTLSTIAGLCGIIVILHRRQDPLAFNGAMLRELRIRPAILTAVVRIGLPTGLQFVMISLAEIAVIGFVNHFGSTATAAYGAANQIASYVQFPALSIGIASSIFGAQSIGAKRADRLTHIVRTGVMLNYIISGGLIVLAYLLNDALLGAFVKDAQALRIAHEFLFLTLWSYAIFGNTTVLSGVMRSSGTVVWPTLISIFSIWGVEVPVAYVLSQHTSLGLRGVWLAYPAGFVVGLLGQTAYYELFWRKRKLAPLVS